MVIASGKGVGVVKEGIGGINGEEDMTWGGKYVIKYTDDVL